MRVRPVPVRHTRLASLARFLEMCAGVHCVHCLGNATLAKSRGGLIDRDALRDAKMPAGDKQKDVSAFLKALCGLTIQADL